VTHTRSILKTTHPRAMAVSITALALWGVQIPGRLQRDTRIHIMVPTRGAHPERHDIKVHWSTQLASVPTTTVHTIRTCDPIEAWMLAAKIATIEELIQLGDQLLRRDNPLTTLQQLRRRVANAGRRRHIRKIRHALEFIRAGTQSIFETWMRLRGTEAGMPEPQINVDIYDQEGNFVARPDLLWEALQTAGEYDGDYHGDNNRRLQDNERRRRMEIHGIHIITATKNDLSDPTRLHRAFRHARTRALTTAPTSADAAHPPPGDPT
jgi:hypothetical protein